MSAEDAHELSGDAKAASSPDPTDLSVRHPLHRTWTMWYDPPAKGKVSQASWQSKVKKLMDFNTVEDFWGCVLTAQNGLVKCYANPNPFACVRVCVWLWRRPALKGVNRVYSMYNNIVPPSNVVAGANYHLFKQGVKPAWEDSENKNGGKWVLHLTQAQSSTINDMWLYTVGDAVSGIPPQPSSDNLWCPSLRSWQ